MISIKGKLALLILDNDLQNSNLIKAETEDIFKHSSNYTIKKGETTASIKTIITKKTEKQKKINEIISKFNSSYYKNKTKIEYQNFFDYTKITLITLKFPETIYNW